MFAWRKNHNLYFVDAPRIFIIADIIRTDEDQGLRIESFVIIIKIRGVCTKYKLHVNEQYSSQIKTNCLYQTRDHENLYSVFLQD